MLDPVQKNKRRDACVVGIACVWAAVRLLSSVTGKQQVDKCIVRVCVCVHACVCLPAPDFRTSGRVNSHTLGSTAAADAVAGSCAAVASSLLGA